jgi:hypothetical protein
MKMSENCCISLLELTTGYRLTNSVNASSAIAAAA